MKLSAIVSAQAGLYAIKETGGYRVTKRASKEPFLVRDADLSRILTHCTDVKQITVRTPNEAESLLEREWRVDRAVRFVIMLFDPSESDEGQDEISVAIESILDNDRVNAGVLNRFSGCGLPDDALIDRAKLYSQPNPGLSSIVGHIISRQDAIKRIRSGYDAIDQKVFGGAAERDGLREELIRSGIFRRLADSVFDGTKVSGVQFSLLSELRSVPNYREVVSEWLRDFERATYDPLPYLEDDEEDLRAWSYGDRGPGGRQAFENALIQQRAILRQVVEGDFDAARRFTMDLIRQQLAQSGNEYAAMSLTRLSQKAKELDAVELFVEWAGQAAKLNPSDPRTRGQLADALFQTGRYDEAREEFDAAKAFGDVAYGITGRARIARALGDLEEARTIYGEIVEKFGDSRDGHYGYSGIAETYRDEGDPKNALIAYSEGLSHYPEESALKCGKAATLADVGSFDEAWLLYEEVLTEDSSNIVALNGEAALLKNSGNVRKACDAYRSLISGHPFDIVSNIGLIDSLRADGDRQEALKVAQNVAKQFSGSPAAMLRLASCLSEAGRYINASQNFKKAIERFPKDIRFYLGAAAAEREGGRYDKALSIYDTALGIFPNHRDVWLGRAHMLRRLGYLKEAEEVYRRALLSNPDDLVVKNALASVLIFKSDFDSALALLDIDNPRMEEEWRSFLLRALLDYETGDLQTASERLVWARPRCAFGRIRDSINSLDASILLRKGQARRAFVVLPYGNNPASNIVSFHAAAAAKNVADAEKKYARLRSNLPKQYSELRDAIAGSYNLADKRHRRSSSWIFAKEAQALSLEMAA